jgi:hypothetical protein
VNKFLIGINTHCLNNEIKTIFSNTNREIKSITIGKGEFSAEIIKQIAEYYIRKVFKNSIDNDS